MNTSLSIRILAIASFSVGLCCFLTGCGKPEASEFREFTQDTIEQSEASDQTERARKNEQISQKTDSIRPDTEKDASQKETSDREPQVVQTTDTDVSPDSGRDSSPDSANANRIELKQSAANSAPNSTQSNTATQSAEQVGPRKLEVLVKNREFKVEGPESALRVSYDDFDLLKVLNMDPVTPDVPKLMPDWLTNLDAKRIRVRGFMYPPLEETGLRGFVLARDNQICCFGRNPKPYDIIEVTLRDGVTVDYIQNRPFDVVGVFHIDPLELDGEVKMVYQIDDAIVIAK